MIGGLGGGGGRRIAVSEAVPGTSTNTSTSVFFNNSTSPHPEVVSLDTSKALLTKNLNGYLFVPHVYLRSRVEHFLTLD